jgi:hypothetical protein
MAESGRGDRRWSWNEHYKKKGGKMAVKIKEKQKNSAKKLEAKRTLGDLDLDSFNNQAPTFKEYAEMWLSLPHDRKESTTTNYISNLRNHIFPAIGSFRIDEIKRKDIKLTLDTLSTRA